MMSPMHGTCTIYSTCFFLAKPVLHAHKRIESVNATNGDSVNLTCDAEGEPSVETIWYMNGERLCEYAFPTYRT